MYDVITIGTATRDVFLESKYFKEFRDKDLVRVGIGGGVAECFSWGGKVEVMKPVITTGGGATNAAVTFARQGFRAASLFKIGDDRPGAGVLYDLEREKVTVLAAKDRELGTGYSTILLSDTGERTILVYRGAANNLKLEDVKKIFSEKPRCYGRGSDFTSELKCRWAYITPGNIAFAVIEHLVKVLHKYKVHIAIDLSNHYLKMGRKKLVPLLGKMALVKGNREEIGLLMGMNPKNEEKLFHEFDRAIGGIAIMSDGPRGVLVSDGNYLYRAGIYKEKRVLDRTGAGDAFGSGFVAGLMHQPRTSNPEPRTLKPECIEYAIKLGSANATSVVEYVGAKTGILTKKQFNDRRWKKLTINRKKL